MQDKTKEELISEMLILQKKFAESKYSSSQDISDFYSKFIANDYLFSLLAEASTSAILVYKGDKVYYVNSAAAEMTGYSKEDILQGEFWKIIHPDFVEMIKEISFKRQKGEEAPHMYEFKIIAKSGKEVWIEFASSSINFQNDIAALGIAFDITERKNAEKSLKESEEKYNKLLSKLPDVVLVHVDGRIVYINERGKEQYGYSADEFLNHSMFEFVYQDDIPIVIENHEKRKRNQDAADGYKIRLKTKSGSLITVEVRATMIEYEGQLATMTVLTDITEKEKIIEQLKLQKVYFQQLFKGLPEGIILLDKNDHIFEANQEFRDMFKYNIDDIIGVAINDLIVPEEFKSEASMLSDMVLKNQHIQVEAIRKCKDGELIHVSILGAPIIMENNQIGTYGIYRDITEQKKTEQALRDALQRFELVIENTPMIAVQGYDRNGIIQHWNAACNTIYGFNKQEAIGKKIQDLIITPDVVVEFEQTLEKIWQSKQATDYSEWRVKNKDGSYRWVYSSMFPVIEHDEVIEVFCMDVDITERKQAEEALKESEERYRLLTESSNDIIAKYTVEGVIQYISPICKSLLGMDSSEFIGHSMFNFFHPDEIDMGKKHLSDRIKNKGGMLIKHLLKRKDGTYISFETSSRIILKPGSDEVAEIVCISRDLTEIKKQEDLLKAKKIAEMENKAKSQFLANMSHEIRNPMNIVVGLSNTLLKTSLNDEQKKYINSIRASSNNLMNILTDVLDFSKIEANKVEVNNTAFELIKLKKEITILCESQAEQNGLKFTINMPDLPCQLYGDYTKVKQMLINLVDNAIKFTPKGSVSITVEKMAETKQSVSLKFIITDTGIGIKEEDYLKIFQSFTQLDKSTTKKYAGTGLGLAIVKNYAELLGGNITFKSEFGKGSNFILELPFSIVEKTNSDRIEENTGKDTNKPIKMSILLAEDDAINQLYLKGFLELHGWKVDSAFNGVQAIEKFEKNKYDIIFMDGQMPKMDGFDAARKIRELEKTKGGHVPIVAITGYAVAGDRERFIEAGMDEHITKPVDENILLEVIMKYSK